MTEAKVLQIQKLSDNGKGIAYLEHPVTKASIKVEVASTLPGDEVQAELGRLKRGRQRAFLRQIIQPSPIRVTPKCAHVSLCGGCVWQQMDYAEQLKKKEEMLRELFSEILKEATPKIHPIIGCAHPWKYRNKMEFSFSQNRSGERFLGLMIEGSRGRVLNLTECHLSSDWTIDVLKAVRQFWQNSSLIAYNPRANTGHLHSLTVRQSMRTSDKMVMLTVSGDAQFAIKSHQIQEFIKAVKETAPHEEISLFLRIKQAIKGAPTQYFEMHLAGPDHISEILEINSGGEKRSLTYKISPTSFFQPNPMQAEILFSRAIQMVSDLASLTVLDLYCGTATLSLALATIAKKVIGIELNPHAVFDAQFNQEINQMDNLEIHRGDVGKVLEELKKSEIAADLIVLDPPRCGLDSLALKNVVTLRPKKILYVSCQPKTQAENIQFFIKNNYALEEMQPIDQFPHTLHLENIALLSLVK